MSLEQLRTRSETIKDLKISERTLNRLLANREIRSYRIGRTVRIPVSAIREYLDRHEVGGDQEAG